MGYRAVLLLALVRVVIGVMRPDRYPRTMLYEVAAGWSSDTSRLVGFAADDKIGGDGGGCSAGGWWGDLSGNRWRACICRMGRTLRLFLKVLGKMHMQLGL